MQKLSAVPSEAADNHRSLPKPSSVPATPTSSPPGSGAAYSPEDFCSSPGWRGDPFPPAFHAHTAAPGGHRGTVGLGNWRPASPASPPLHPGARLGTDGRPTRASPAPAKDARRRLRFRCHSATASPRPLGPGSDPAPPPGTRPPHAARAGVLPLAPPSRVPRHPDPGSRKRSVSARARGGARRSSRRLSRVSGAGLPGEAASPSLFHSSSFRMQS